MAMTKEEYKKSEKKQTVHRSFNTLLSVGVIIMGLVMINPVIESTNDLYEQMSGIKQEKVIKNEIAQIASDESYRRCVYNDSEGKATVGFGHLVTGKEDIINGCITPESAIKLLKEDYSTASRGVERNYPWADGEVRLILTNMTFQLGSTGVSKFEETIKAFKASDYEKASAEMIDSKWCVQTTNRCARLVGRTLALGT